MTTTLAWLQTYEYGTLAFSLAVDGYNLVYTTTSSTDAMATAYAATDWTTVKSGLDIIGSTTQRINPFAPKLDADSLTFRILDHDETLLGTVLCEAKGRAGAPYLTGDVVPADTVAYVNSTTGFTSGTDIYIGQECATQNVLNATTFTLATRGKYAVYGTDDDASHYARRHICEDNATASYSNSPRVLTTPRTWYNRLVRLRVHHLEGGAWSTVANSHTVWAGRIKSWRDEGDGWISITCTSVAEMLGGDLFSDQWTAELPEGRYIADGMRAIAGDGYFGATGQNTNAGTLTNYGGWYTWDQMQADVGATVGAWSTADIAWSGQMITVSGQPRFQIVAKATAATLDNTCTASIRLHPDLLLLLGFTSDLTQYNAELQAAITDANGRRVVERKMTRVGNAFYLTGYWCPVKYVTPGYNNDATVVNQRGTWVEQPVPLYGNIGGCTGFVAIGNNVYWSAFSSPLLTLKAGWAESIEFAEPNPFARASIIREGEMSGALEVKQVWLLEGRAGTEILRLLLSTGSSGYSHNTYDVYGPGVGLGLPSTMVDVDSFLDIDAAIPTYLFYFDKPTKAAKILETLCALTGRHPVFKNGKLRLTRIGVEAQNLASVYSLTEDNKARPEDRTVVEYGADGVLNRITLKYDASPLTTQTRRTETIVIAFSASDYGTGQATIEAPGLRDPAPFYDVACTALANLAYPMAVVGRTYNASLIDLSPGDVAELDDNYLADPALGTRGVTDLPVVVLEAGFDWATGVGRLRAGYTPALPVAGVRLWAPCARVDETQANAGYNAGTYVLTCKAHEFSASTDAVDASYFPVGAHVRVTEIDPPVSDSPTAWVGVVASQSGNTIGMAAALSSPAWDTAKRYIVELDDASTVSDSVAATYAFIADDATGGTGNSDNDASFWWETQPGYASASIPYTTEYARPVALADDTGEPHSCAWYYYATAGINCYFSNKSAQNHVTEYLSVTGSSADSANESLVYGPARVPIYGHDSRSLAVNVQSYTDSGTATVYVYTADAPPAGTAVNALTNPITGYSRATFSVTATEATWQTATTIVPACAAGRPKASFVWVTLKPATGGNAYLKAIDIAEDPL